MDITEAKISEIKNLNLIYVFTTDNILKNKTSEYIGVKVVYDKDKILNLDYKDKHFELFLKKILSRYNKEKNKRDIVLLGDLTKKLVQDSFFAIVEENKEFTQPYGILVNVKKNQIKGFEKYLSRVLKIILKAVKNYEYINIDSIDGFNYKYVVNYSIGNIKKQIYMLIFVRENGNLDFKISNIEGEIVNINGSIEDNFLNIKINWHEVNKNLTGTVLYDSHDQLIVENLYKNETPIISRETTDTLLEEDEKIISFYLDLCNLEKLQNVMKIDDNCYFLSSNSLLSKEEDGIFYKNISYQISIFDNDVIIKHKEKTGLSKYNNQVRVMLDEITNEYNFKKLLIDDNLYILMEKRNNKNGLINYSYNILKINEDKKLFEPYNIEENHKVQENFKTLDSAKEYIINMKGGIQ